MKIILIADDEQVILDVLRNYLSEKFEVKCFNNPRDIIKAITVEKIEASVIILDIDFKVGISGTDAVSIIRKKNPDQKIILISATTHGKSMQKFLEGNNVMFLEKPFSNDNLFNVLKEIDVL